MKRTAKLVYAITAVVAAGCTTQATFHASEQSLIDDNKISEAAEHVIDAQQQLDMMLNAPGGNEGTEEFQQAADDVTGRYFETLSVLTSLVSDQFNVDALALEHSWKRMDAVHRIAVMFALTQLGEPYIRDPYRSTGEDGYDCSGLTLAAFHAAGITLHHKAYVQQLNAEPVPAFNQPGDLVFFRGGDTAGGPHDIGHVGIYLGEGLMVNARAGVERVVIERVNDIAQKYPADHWGRVRQIPSG